MNPAVNFCFFVHWFHLLPWTATQPSPSTYPFMMPPSSVFFGTALTKLRTLPTIPQCVGVAYLKSTFTKTRFTNHIVFLRTCKRTGFVPKGFKLKSPVASDDRRLSVAVHRITHHASMRLMAETIRSYIQHVNKASHQISHMRSQLRNLVDYQTSRYIIDTVQEANRGLHTAMNRTKQQKMERSQPKTTSVPTTVNPTHSHDSNSDPDSNLVVTIPPDLDLPEDQRHVLSRGLKFVPLQPTVNRMYVLFLCQRFFRRLRLAAHFSNASPPPPATTHDDLAKLFPRQPSTWTPSPGAFPALDFYIDTCQREIAQLRPRPLKHTNLSTAERKALTDLKKRTDVVIKPADKGGAITVWRRDLYVEEAKRQLGDKDSYREITKSTVKPDNTLIRKTIKLAIDKGHLPTEAHNAIHSEPKESNFYLLPKIHKADTPGRPIVSACACPTVIISDFLDKILQPLVATLPTYIKDTNDTLRLLEGFSFPDDSMERHIFTMDVVSLYTSIPHSDGLKALEHYLEKSDIEHLHIPTILRLAELVLSLNSFAFEDHHYQQTRGVAMGTKMGPSFACLFVGFVEEQALSHYTGTQPALFKRYIDDCLGVSVGSRDDLVSFIQHMSNFHPALRYTHEISSTSLSFLDLSISSHPECSKLSITVFYKPTDSHAYLLYNSSHPSSTRNSIPYSQFQRLRRICSREQEFEIEAKRMSTFFKARQYPEDVVQTALERARSTSRTEALTPKETGENEDRVVAVIPYHPHNLPVCRILRRNFTLLQQDPKLKEIFSKPPLIAFQRDKNLRDLLVRSKLKPQVSQSTSRGCRPCGDKGCKTCPFIDASTTLGGHTGTFTVRSSLSCQSRDIVYILTCTLCSKLYVGETCRSLAERFSEHLRSMKLGYSNPVGQHFASPYHSFSHAKIAAVWQNPRDRVYRKHMESRIISRLGTTQPAGMNVRVADV